MHKPPQPPRRGFLVYIEVFAFLILLVQVFRSHEPSSFKVGIAGLLLFGLYTGVVFHLGRRYEWSRLKGGDKPGDEQPER